MPDALISFAHRLLPNLLLSQVLAGAIHVIGFSYLGNLWNGDPGVLAIMHTLFGSGVHGAVAVGAIIYTIKGR